MLVPISYVALEMQPAYPKTMPHQYKEDKTLIIPFTRLQC